LARHRSRRSRRDGRLLEHPVIIRGNGGPGGKVR
jgi:hypothetical protein